MRYIVTEEIAEGVQNACPVDHKNPVAYVQNPSKVLDQKIGDYLETDKDYELVSEKTVIPMVRKMVCVGAQPYTMGGMGATYNQLVLFDKKIGDVYHTLKYDDMFFTTERGDELLVHCPSKPENEQAPNYGFYILRNLTRDKIRKDWLAKQK